MHRLLSEIDQLQRPVGEMKRTRVPLSEWRAGATATSDSHPALDRKSQAWPDATAEASNEIFIDPSHSPEQLNFNQFAVLRMVDDGRPPLTSGLARQVGDVRQEFQKRYSEYEELRHEVIAHAARAAESGR